MKDLIFDNNDKLIGIGDSVRKHQEDILVHHKGWDKFSPHSGVGIIDYLGDEGSLSNLKNDAELELEKDGMKINATRFDSSGNIQIDAKY